MPKTLSRSICLKEGVDARALIGRKLNGYAAEAQMAEAVQIYLDTVRAELRTGDLLDTARQTLTVMEEKIRELNAALAGAGLAETTPGAGQ